MDLFISVNTILQNCIRKVLNPQTLSEKCYPLKFDQAAALLDSKKKSNLWLHESKMFSS